MKCTECIAAGQTSKIYNRGGSKTLLASANESFYDEEGCHHYHDPNTTTWAYECSKGHRWQQKEKSPCPQGDCEYGKEEQ